MSKEKKEFVCQNCGYKSLKWLGRCPECSNWESFMEETHKPFKVRASKGQGSIGSPSPLANIDEKSLKLQPTGVCEFDRVLGGGFTANSVILIAGDPGIGKSTLLLQTLAKVCEKSGPSLYVTGEESPQQLKMRAERLGIRSQRLLVMPETDTDIIIGSIKETKPAVAAIDSIQTVYSKDVDSNPGTVSQIRESAYRLIELAKQNNVCIFFVGHITKEGQIAGPMTLEHMVDTVIYFEGDNSSQYRILRAVKNRFGPTNEIGIFEMSENGLKEVCNPSHIFLSEKSAQTPGSIVTACMEGTRPFLIEVQALCSVSNYAVPARIATGIDRNRVLLLIAILEKKLGLNLAGHDVYVNITGGFKLNERAGDLAVASAIASSFLNKTPRERTFLFGEIGLTGEVRAARFPSKRISEGEKLGYNTCIVPIDNYRTLNHKESKIRTISIKSVEDIPDTVFKE